MSIDDMHALVRALQSSMERAQNALDRRQEKTIERMIDLAEDGAPEFVTWRCPLLSGDGSTRSHELLRVPWASLASQTMMGVSELSVTLKHPEFDLPENAFDQNDGEIFSDGCTDVRKGTASTVKIHLQGEGGRAGAVIQDALRVGTIGPRGLICEFHGDRPGFQGSDARQEKVLRKSGWVRSIGISLAIVVIVLTIIGLTAWLTR